MVCCGLFSPKHISAFETRVFFATFRLLFQHLKSWCKEGTWDVCVPVAGSSPGLGCCIPVGFTLWQLRFQGATPHLPILSETLHRWNYVAK